jgi:isoquinoline 1-oxidoreductase beta subunit
VPTNVPLRKPGEWRMLGRDVIKSLDVQDIVHGRAKYGIDVRRDGMLFASVERATIFGATVDSFDATEALKVPGVKQVVEVKGELKDAGMHSGVAVIATNTWAAMQGRRALKVKWIPGPHAQESIASYSKFMRNAVSGTG